jgi:hypothetical protein
MKKLFAAVGLTLLAMLLTGCEAGEVGLTILDNLIPIVFAILTPILALLARALIRWLQEKLDFEVDIEKENKLLELVMDGIAYAEEQSKKAIKEDKKLPSGDKLRLAIEYVSDRIEELGLPKLAGDKLAKMIESRLGQTR